MGNVNFWISIGSAIIALISLVFTIIKYNKHEKWLNKQQAEINSYELKRFQEEELATLKAVVKGNIVSYTKGSVKLKVFNAGKANARNIRVSFISSIDGLLFDDFEVIELLNPHRGFDYEIHLANGHVGTVKVKYIWDDDSGKNNEHIDHLQIP